MGWCNDGDHEVTFKEFSDEGEAREFYQERKIEVTKWNGDLKLINGSVVEEE